MAIFKNNINGNFSMIQNDLIIDLRLSAPEFRMYCYLCSRPGTWKINNADISKKLGIGSRNTISKYWNNLMELGLISRKLAKAEDGKFAGYDYALNPIQPHSIEPCINDCDTEPCITQPYPVETVSVSDRVGPSDTHSNNDSFSNNDSLNNTERKVMSENKFSDVCDLADDFEVVDPVIESGEKRKKVAAKKEKVETTETSPTFEEFWEHYDKKVGKKEKVQAKWEKLSQEKKVMAMNHIRWYKISQPNKKYRKNPETYLNNDGWNDEIIIDQVIQAQKPKMFSRQTEETIRKNATGW